MIQCHVAAWKEESDIRTICQSAIRYFVKYHISTEIVPEKWNFSHGKLKIRRLKNLRGYFFAHFSFDFIGTDSEFVPKIEERSAKCLTLSPSKIVRSLKMRFHWTPPGYRKMDKCGHWMRMFFPIVSAVISTINKLCSGITLIFKMGDFISRKKLISQKFMFIFAAHRLLLIFAFNFSRYPMERWLIRALSATI